ncbi:ABC-three component system middle component 6 [Glycomyces arizonensis]|uniref:ABC-three component system middle component 6 n=1 Tax=Glycomyces arizonensis TaxID=256035 RepID=UPI0004025A9A|nr:ABC-three component system middle component 6 [Glycomyces arizonensis]
MLLPNRSVSPQRALLSVAAQISLQLDAPRTVSETWARLREWREANGFDQPITFGWFQLALDMLYALGLVGFDGRTLRLTGKR